MIDSKTKFVCKKHDWLIIASLELNQNTIKVDMGSCPYCVQDLAWQLMRAPHTHDWNPTSVGGAACLCGEHSQSWYCPKSSDHLCHYDKGNLDACDFCGLPEERK